MSEPASPTPSDSASAAGICPMASVAVERAGMQWTDDAGGAGQAAWEDIGEVVATTRKFGRRSRICLQFQLDGQRLLVEANEKTEGWNDLLDALPMALRGCVPANEWYHDVAGAIFGPIRLSIYTRN